MIVAEDLGSGPCIAKLERGGVDSGWDHGIGKLQRGVVDCHCDCRQEWEQ